MLETIRRHRRYLHQIPEIGFELPQTQAYLLAQLEPLGARLETVAQSGVLAYFDFGKTETVAFRSDMDALPVTEPASCPFASRHEGRMHACGHDAHMAALLALAERISGRADALPRNVLLIFQPAEESGGGAEVIVRSGALERYHVARLFALHVQPALPAGTVSTRPGAFAATASEIHLRLRGMSAHVARWREGRDALAAGAATVRAIDAFERALPAQMPRLIKLCAFRAGASTNVVADLAEIDGTVRAFSREDHACLKSEIARIARKACAPFGVEAKAAFSQSYPPVVNDPKLYDLFCSTLGGIDFAPMTEPDLIAEDFSFYQESVPGLMFYLGIGACEPLHSPLFHLDEEALLNGLEVFQRLAALTD